MSGPSFSDLWELLKPSLQLGIFYVTCLIGIPQEKGGVFISVFTSSFVSISHCLNFNDKLPKYDLYSVSVIPFIFICHYCQFWSLHFKQTVPSMTLHFCHQQQEVLSNMHQSRTVRVPHIRVQKDKVSLKWRPDSSVLPRDYGPDMVEGDEQENWYYGC